MADIEQPIKRLNPKDALGIVSHVEVGVAVVAVTVCRGWASSVTIGNDSSAVLLGGEAVVGRLAVDRVGELVDCDASGGVPVELVVWASFALLLA